MRKHYGIKWRKEDKQKLAKEVAKFNAKITRAEKKNPDLKSILPERLSTKALADKITSRKDFNNAVKSIERFMRKDALHPKISKAGAQTTKWAYNEAKIMNNRRNRMRQAEYDMIHPSAERGTMRSIKEQNLQPRPFKFDEMNQRAWEKFVKAVEKQSRADYPIKKAEQYKSNYLRSIENQLGAAGERLRKLVDKIPANILYENAYENPFVGIDFPYTLAEAEGIAERAFSAWEDILSNL